MGIITTKKMGLVLAAGSLCMASSAYAYWYPTTSGFDPTGWSLTRIGAGNNGQVFLNTYPAPAVILTSSTANVGDELLYTYTATSDIAIDVILQGVASTDTTSYAGYILNGVKTPLIPFYGTNISDAFLVSVHPGYVFGWYVDTLDLNHPQSLVIPNYFTGPISQVPEPGITLLLLGGCAFLVLKGLGSRKNHQFA